MAKSFAGKSEDSIPNHGTCSNIQQALMTAADNFINEPKGKCDTWTFTILATLRPSSGEEGRIYICIRIHTERENRIDESSTFFFSFPSPSTLGGNFDGGRKARYYMRLYLVRKQGIEYVLFSRWGGEGARQKGRLLWINKYWQVFTLNQPNVYNNNVYNNINIIIWSVCGDG